MFADNRIFCISSVYSEWHELRLRLNYDILTVEMIYEIWYTDILSYYYISYRIVSWYMPSCYNYQYILSCIIYRLNLNLQLQYCSWGKYMVHKSELICCEWTVECMSPSTQNLPFLLNIKWPCPAMCAGVVKPDHRQSDNSEQCPEGIFIIFDRWTLSGGKWMLVHFSKPCYFIYCPTQDLVWHIMGAFKNDWFKNMSVFIKKNIVVSDLVVIISLLYTFMSMDLETPGGTKSLPELMLTNH